MDKTYILNQKAYQKKFDKNLQKIKNLKNQVKELEQENKIIETKCHASCNQCEYRCSRIYTGGLSDVYTPCELDDIKKLEELANAGILKKHQERYFIPSKVTWQACIYFKKRHTGLSWADR
ncbi:MAG: hypothetical protein [Wendovervirus sonii]|uniref:Uncharacterized protein n=1 Tax=phage Lak_Megaphage_Sonny TaxID=3109229 RepID=A0ABZ0Z5H6_9CAUD|nr:MAG: hypothetical protein [phage Lak_Megaphage_Sonny]